MAKTKLSTRILNAVRALRGEPWPTVIEGPKITYTRPAVQTIGAEVTLPIILADLQGPEVADAEGRRSVATAIGAELLKADAIKIAKTLDIYADELHYRGQVRVVMPGEEDDGHG